MRKVDMSMKGGSPEYECLWRLQKNEHRRNEVSEVSVHAKKWT